MKKLYYCKDCGKEISYNTVKYGSGMCRSCFQKGKNNPNYKHGKWNKTRCIKCGKNINYSSKTNKCYSCYKKTLYRKKYFCKICGKIITKSKNLRCRECYFKNRKHEYKCIECGNEVSHSWNKRCRSCSNKQHSNFMIGTNNPNYFNGKSKEPYTIKWNNKLKNSIKERDNNECQNPDCVKNKNMRLCVHHIDYNKKNCDSRNLITLCNFCHGKTNANRIHWKRFFNKLMEVYNYD